MPYSCGYMLKKVRDTIESDRNAVTDPVGNLQNEFKEPSSELNDLKTSKLVLNSICDSICNSISESSRLNITIQDYTNDNDSKTDSETPYYFEEKDLYDTEEAQNDINENDCQADNYDQADEKANAKSDIYDFSQTPLQVTGCWKEFDDSARNNYTRGCKWAPDGTCILTCSDDNALRVFNLPNELWDLSKWEDMSEMMPVFKISEGELIYDYCWYPQMNSNESATCCFASSSKNSTVHLWDAFTGELRCSYRNYDQMDEIVAARSISFDSEGEKIFCGFEKTIRVFDVCLPGRKFVERKTFDKKSGQFGIISCFGFSPTDKNFSAAGSYSKSIGIYSEPSGTLECVLEGQKGGVTQLQFSPDGNLLYSGGRKDPEILCWDIRNLGSVLFCLRRSCTTNQRMYFDISPCGRYIISGNHNGAITVWDSFKESIESPNSDFNILEPVLFYLGHDDCVNGISIHPTFPLLCSSSGQRKFAELADDDENMFSTKIPKSDNSLRLWWIGKMS